MFMWPFIFFTVLPLAANWEVSNMLKYYSDEHEGNL